MTQRVVILGSGNGNDLALVREFGAAGWQIDYAAEQANVAFRSRRVHATHVLPADSAGWLDALVPLGDQDRPPLLVPTNDGSVARVLGHWDSVARLFRLSYADAPSIRRLFEKASLYELCAALGLPHSRSFGRIAGPADRLTDDLELPCVVKPDLPKQPMFAGQRDKVLFAATRAELDDALARRLPGTAVVVTEALRYQDTGLCFLYVDPDGVVRFEHFAITVLCWPTRDGNTVLCFTTPPGSVEDALDASRRLIAAAGYRGVVEVEMVRDLDDGQWKVLDVQCRTTLQNRMLVVQGFDFVTALAEFGGSRGEVVRRRPARRCAWLELERFSRVLRDPDIPRRERLRWMARAIPLPITHRLAISSWDPFDPRPFLQNFYYALRPLRR